MTADVLTGGFADAPRDAARAFRAALNALARPGRIEVLAGAVPPAPLSVAAGTLLLTLADGTTPVHLAPSHDRAELRDWLSFHCGAPLVGADRAVFAVGSWEALQPLSRFAIGQPEYPDRSATLIVEVAALEPANAWLSGPGIKGSAELHLPEVETFAANNALFPLGFDCYLTSADRIAGLPRSTKVEAL
ncbi:MAG: phosphonate C-P lyase system protein PhnH [Cereibacter sphaeroides]|uniref:Phosphonate C-P lyase system protein PhnH n=1 Tax=Cereibacter sphaeroides TaxID=1063 RepID=A0A2W5SA12_CERSP|nr:MAG: phosphonate C-P lyase system protein PhnH [Cereibacter sphaeroides]